MTLSASPPKVTATVVDDEQDPALVLTCPLCHTPTSLTQNAVDAGGEWRCVRCGQRWDATRLSAVAAYAAWLVERAASAPKAERASLSHTVANEHWGDET